MSRDPAQLGVNRIEGKQVLQTSVRNNIHTLSLTFDNGETIETTGEHPFYVEGEGFTPAGRLAIGNAIVTRAGPATRLVRVVWNAAPKTVYNFTVAGDHTYFVGKNGGGLWVHNVDCRLVKGALGDIDGLTDIRPTHHGLDLNKIDEYEKIMRSGNWKWANAAEPIAIDGAGFVTHGHHRIAAAARAGKLAEALRSAVRGRDYIGPLLRWGDLYTHH